MSLCTFHEIKMIVFLQISTNYHSFYHWVHGNHLNSHNVMAPISETYTEVSGHVQYKRGLEPHVSWQVIPKCATCREMRLRHVDTGRYLSVTQNIYPRDWGGELLEVAGLKVGSRGEPDQASEWEIVFSRQPLKGYN